MNTALDRSGSVDEKLRRMLASVAHGDRDDFGRLYDQLSPATYAVCLLAGKPLLECTMQKTWLFIWVNAAALYGRPLSTRDVILNVAYEMSRKGRISE